MKTSHSIHMLSCLLAGALLTVLSACGTSAPPPAARHGADIGVIVEATELALAFEAKEHRAAALYTGKRGRIKGLFSKTEPLADGHIALTFKTSAETFRPVRCVFDVTASNALNKLAIGDPVTVTGNIVGFAGSKYFVTVEDCLLDEETH